MINETDQSNLYVNITHLLYSSKKQVAMTKVMNIPYTPNVPTKIAFRNSLIDIYVKINRVIHSIVRTSYSIEYSLLLDLNKF